MPGKVCHASLTSYIFTTKTQRNVHLDFPDFSSCFCDLYYVYDKFVSSINHQDSPRIEFKAFSHISTLRWNLSPVVQAMLSIILI
jgi:hypothetical protein